MPDPCRDRRVYSHSNKDQGHICVTKEGGVFATHSVYDWVKGQNVHVVNIQWLKSGAHNEKERLT